MNERIVMLYIAAALAEVSGCYAVWKMIHGAPTILLAISAACTLLAFAIFLAWVPSQTAGKTYAAYGAIYIIVAYALAKFVEGATFSMQENIGLAVVIAGAAIMTTAKTISNG